jgi:hypothetical protein
VEKKDERRDYMPFKEVFSRFLEILRKPIKN